MNIRLDDRYKIESDKDNFILKEIKTYEKGKNAGQQYEDIAGYYVKPEHVLQAYLTKTTLNSDATTLEELLIEIRTTRRYLKSILGAKSLWE